MRLPPRWNAGITRQGTLVPYCLDLSRNGAPRWSLGPHDAQCRGHGDGQNPKGGPSWSILRAWWRWRGRCRRRRRRRMAAARIGEGSCVVGALASARRTPAPHRLNSVWPATPFVRRVCAKLQVRWTQKPTVTRSHHRYRRLTPGRPGRSGIRSASRRAGLVSGRSGCSTVAGSMDCSAAST